MMDCAALQSFARIPLMLKPWLSAAAQAVPLVYFQCWQIRKLVVPNWSSSYSCLVVRPYQRWQASFPGLGSFSVV